MHTFIIYRTRPKLTAVFTVRALTRLNAIRVFEDTFKINIAPLGGFYKVVQAGG